MKKHFLLLFVFISTFSFGQYPKLVVQLTDKASNTNSISNPSNYLSTRALQRRTKQNLAIDSFDLPVTKRYIDSIKASGNVTILNTSKWLNQVLILTTDPAVIAKIQTFPFVKSVKGIGLRVTNSQVTHKNKFQEKIDPIDSSHLIFQRNTADFYNYGLSYNQVHIHEGEFLHNKGFRGETMQIGILDAGFLQYKTLTAFDSIRINGQVLGERDFVAFDNSVNEDDSHGTYVLSIMSTNWPGQMIGTSPKAKYWLIRTENAPTEFPIEEFNWVAGAEFADSAGVDIINSSLGYSDFDDPAFDYTYANFYTNTSISSRGATMASKKGMIIMNSAGNSGNSSWKYITFPSDGDSTCAVGAVNTSGAVASFSSYGYSGRVKPNVASVGSGTVIAGFNNLPSSGSGTSFSSPNMTGLVACLWQAFPNLSNMKILDALYKSSDKYTTPNNRVGFGIPNMKKAYRNLKTEQNIALYGTDWLWATPNPFTTQIDTRFIGQVDGNAKLDLTDAFGKIIATINLSTEISEVYYYSFTNLSSLVAGVYKVIYTDNSKTRTIELQKGNLFDKDWLRALPIPFKNALYVYLKAPETGDVILRILDAKGRLIETKSLSIIQNQVQAIAFSNISKLQSGVYYLQYIGKDQKKIIRLLKQ